MFIEHDIKKYIIFAEDSIVNALEKINENKKRFVITVSVSGIVEGVLTDGDFRRWVINQKEVDLQKPVFEIHNRNFASASIKDETDSISSKFSHKIYAVPLLDQSKRLRAIAFSDSEGIRIDNKIISDTSPVFVIAEIGNNHNGDIDLAKRLVDQAVAAGADCAKFQLRDMDVLYRKSKNSDKRDEDLGAQYTLDLLRKYQLKDNDLFKVFDYCRKKGIIPLCTPWDTASLKKLVDYSIPAFKVASADLTNHFFLSELIKTKMPLICSTGMSSESEIKDSVALLKDNNTQFILLHCNSTYPAPFKDVNLNYLKRLKKIGTELVGYSGHERGIHVPIAAVAKGAKVIEKHFTLDRNMEGNDHKISLLPEEFKQMVEGIRQVEMGLGSDNRRHITQGERINREVLGKSLMVNQDLKKGYVITRSMIDIKSPGTGLQPYHIDKLIGRRVVRDMQNGDIFFPSDISDAAPSPKDYNFQRPFGIAVRYHDYTELKDLSNFDLVEFHLSYRDLELNPEDIFKTLQQKNFLVHSPELFKNDHIMDLCSADETYRQGSIQELQLVVKITNALNTFFPNTRKPKIIVNAGGFSQDRAIAVESRAKLYDLVADSLDKIDVSGTEIIIQTMPPFPWHFGGQRFHNLFLDPYEIKQFCEKYGMRICLDVSHSKLACNYFKWSFSRFVKLVGPYTAHVHIVDAIGIDGEGLQIGDGDIDFDNLSKLIDDHCPDAGFIPEIWQGHKNKGEGFWIALDRLEKWF